MYGYAQRDSNPVIERLEELKSLVSVPKPLSVAILDYWKALEML
jgi:hypothetical protein